MIDDENDNDNVAGLSISVNNSNFIYFTNNLLSILNASNQNDI